LRVLQVAKRIYGEEHIEVASTLHSLAGLYVNMGDFAKAEPLRVSVLQIRRKVYGPQHPETAMALDQLGQMYCELQEFDRAEKLLLDAVRIARQDSRKDNLDLALHCHNL